MEYLIKQSRRVKFSDQGPGSRIQPHNPTYFIQEKKRPGNWFGKQMNQDYDLNDLRRATAVAAAAYAVVSATDSNISDKTTLGGHSKSTFTRIKSQKEVPKISSPQPDIGKMNDVTISRPHKQTSGKHSLMNSEKREEKESETAVKVVGPSPSATRTPTFTEKKPKVNKVPSFSDDQLSTRKTIKPDPDPEIKMPKPDIPTTPKPVYSPVPGKRLGGTEADSWERAKLAKIKSRYDKAEARISSWENEKKTKARCRLDKTENEPERKRLKALERFRSEIDDINQIVDGARSNAKERRIHDELKVKEKANNYRKTGKPPTTTCFCF